MVVDLTDRENIVSRSTLVWVRAEDEIYLAARQIPR